MTANLDPPRTYDPVGRCIYCGSDGGEKRLSDEHIIASSLGGTQVLPKASCHACAKVTSYLDGYSSRGIFHEVRTHAGLPTRRPRPTEFPVTLIFDDREEQHAVPASSHPSALLMLDFDMPGILSGKTADTCTNFSVRRHALIRRTKEFDDWVATKGAKAASVHVWFKPAPFARMLAKVAHSYTVATLGLDGFTPFLPDAILRPDYPHLAYLVGGDPNTPSPDFGCLHRLSLETRFVDGKQMIVVRIRLFASSGDQEHGLPIYYVVAGEALQPAKDSDFKHPTSSISGCRTLSSARFA